MYSYNNLDGQTIPYHGSVSHSNQVNQSFYYSRNAKGKDRVASEDHNSYQQLIEQLENEIQELLTTSSNSKPKEIQSESELLEVLIKGYQEQREIIDNLQKKVDKLVTKSNPFVDVFKSLPANYPVNEVLLNGNFVTVSRFLNINLEGEIVHFSDEEGIITLNVNKVDGINWGRGHLG